MPYVFPWPYTRQHYDGIDNPMYDQDIQVAMEAVIQAMLAIVTGNLNQATGFCILCGFTWDGSTNYTPGIFYLNGSFYLMETGITTGQCMTANVVPGLSEPFDDGNTRPIYNFLQATVANAVVAGVTTPAFTGNMNYARYNLQELKAEANSLLTTQALLMEAAFLNVGQVTGTVAAGDDPRLAYTAAQMDARYAQIANVLLKGGPTIYTPTTPGDPLCKGYGDATYIPVYAKGFSALGNADPTGGTTHTISLGLTLTTTFYHVDFTVESNSVNPANDTYYQPVIRNKTATSFDIYFRNASGAAQNVTLVWRVTPE